MFLKKSLLYLFEFSSAGCSPSTSASLYPVVSVNALFTCMIFLCSSVIRMLSFELSKIVASRFSLASSVILSLMFSSTPKTTSFSSSSLVFILAKCPLNFNHTSTCSLEVAFSSISMVCLLFFMACSISAVSKST